MSRPGSQPPLSYQCFSMSVKISRLAFFFLGSLNGRPASLVVSRTRAAQENGREGEERRKKLVQLCDGDDEEVVVDVFVFCCLDSYLTSFLYLFPVC